MIASALNGAAGALLTLGLYWAVAAVRSGRRRVRFEAAMRRAGRPVTSHRYMVETASMSPEARRAFEAEIAAVRKGRRQ